MIGDTIESRVVEVGGLSTHFLELGDGPVVVLLHSGEFGACAEASWRGVIPALADSGYRVIAPDWLGFGKSDKVVDFADPTGRRMRHMGGFFAAMGLESVAVVGSSMGASYLARDLGSDAPLLSTATAVLTSGGGFVPNNEARRLTLDYDQTVAGMRRILGAMMYRRELADDDEYVRWRHALSLEPGAWQCVASARLRPPAEDGSEPGPMVGKPDLTPYESISVPTLIVAGHDDPLRLPRYANELVTRIPDAELHVYKDCGHMPNLEYPDEYAADLIEFLGRRYVPQAGDRTIRHLP